MGAVHAASEDRGRLAPFGAGDQVAMAPILDAAFGPGRLAKTSERVRENGAVFAPELSCAAFIDGALVGGCQIWRIRVGGSAGLFLGPLAVHPHAQHGGLGAQLVRACLDACRQAGENAVLLVGAPGFFEPLGFAAVPPGQISLPGPVDPKRLLWQALRVGGIGSLHGPVSGFRVASPA